MLIGPLDALAYVGNVREYRLLVPFSEALRRWNLVALGST